MKKETNAVQKQTNATNLSIKFYNGNVKVGDMLTFNKLAGNNVINGCVGSCGKHCKGCWDTENWKYSDCYVAKAYIQYGDVVINSHIKNTLAMRDHTEDAIKELNKQLSRKRTIKPVRIHAAGEIETTQELKGWLWIAEQNPERPFYVYTKAYGIIDKVMQEYQEKGKLPPENFFINISIWHEHGIECYKRWEHIPTIRGYIYDDETYDYEKAGLKIDGSCPAYKKNKKGKVKLSHELTCDKCKLCFKNTAKLLTCLSH